MDFKEFNEAEAKIPREAALAAFRIRAAIVRLGETPRSGWVKMGIPNPETVSKHCYEIGVLAYLTYDIFGGEKLGISRGEFMLAGLLHDISEAIMGDQIVEEGLAIDNKKKETKHEEEDAIASWLFREFPDAENLLRIYRLATKDDKVAPVMKMLDRFQMARTALIYEIDHNVDLSEFFDNAAIYLTAENTPEEVRQEFSNLLIVRPNNLPPDVLESARKMGGVNFLLEINRGLNELADNFNET